MPLSAGQHTLRIIAVGPYSLDYLELRAQDGGSPPPTPTPPPPPARQPQVTITHPADGSTISSREQTAFAASAFDPSVGSQDGAGISRVQFDLVGTGIGRSEQRVRYCMFGGDSACEPMSPTQFDTLADGSYTLRVQAMTHSGMTTEASVRFILRRGNSPPPAESPTTATIWQPWSATLTSARSYGNPYRDVELRVTFSGPNGQTFRTVGFWDGERTFRIRTRFPSTGTWNWQTEASDRGNAGLHNVRGTVNVRAYTGDNPLYRHGAIRVSADGRYLTYADGTPFFWLGDTAWGGPIAANDTAWTQYLDTRAQQGFSVVMVAPSPQWMAERDARGQRPWNGTPGEQINPAYWQAFAAKVAAANERGLLVVVVGLMHPDARDLASDAAVRFARQLVGRLHGDHVIFSPSFDAPASRVSDSVGTAIAAATDQHLITQHPGTPSGQTTNVHAEHWFAQSYLDIAGNQTGHNGGDRTLSARQEITWNLSLAARHPVKPVINLEGFYDAGGTTAGMHARYQGTAHDARAGMYRSWLSGALGMSYGAYGIWNWKQDDAAYRWDRALQYPSARQMTIVRRVLHDLPWWTLRPAHERLRSQPSNWTERAVLAFTTDQRAGLLYTPVTRAITLDLRNLSGTFRSTWIDPQTGQRRQGPSLPANRVHTLTPPAGGADWLLLLEQ
ncbi:MAG: DUF4038 domain-containing protein [Blastochloris sp.]|nr:DUF4038 domain-containing protein [Blastochloris sp.]